MSQPANQLPRRPAATDRSWRPQLLGAALFGALVTLVFWNGDLDLGSAAAFYRPDNPLTPWPGEYEPLWQFFYYGAPLAIGILTIGSLLILILGRLRPAFLSWRRPAAVFLLTLVLGPGLLVNLVLKENWGRPRPRQVEQFGGDMAYLPPLQMGETRDGKSFVAGHASVGFSLFAFWFVWRRRRPRLAGTFFAAATGLGLLMGLGRMAAGAHFLSDVLWSGLVTFTAALAVHYFLLREAPPTAAASAMPRVRPLALLGYGMLGGALLVGSLVSLPVNENIDYRPAAGQLPLPGDLELDLDQGQVELQLLPPSPAAPLAISGRVRGFGFPNYEIQYLGLQGAGPDAPFRFRLRQKGFFIELDTRLKVALSAPQVERLHLQLNQGDVRVVRAPGAVGPVLDLHGGSGEPLTNCNDSAGSGDPCRSDFSPTTDPANDAEPSGRNPPAGGSVSNKSG